MAEEEVFARLLESLQAEGELPAADDLSALSDLNRSQIDRFEVVWAALNTPNRQRLLTTLGEQADAHIELQFDRVNYLALRDPDAEVRRQGIGNLWESQDPRLVPLLLKMVKGDPVVEVRIAATQALGRFILLGQLSKLNTSLLADIEDTLLLQWVQEDDIGLRSASVEALGYSSRLEVEDIIQSAYASSDEGLRQSSLIAMGRSANEIWNEPILADLTSQSPELRAAAARAAGELELRTATSFLVDLLDDVDDNVRMNAIWSLGQIGGTNAREALEALQELLDAELLASWIEEALEHIAFLEGTPDFLIYDFDDDEDEFS